MIMVRYTQEFGPHPDDPKEGKSFAACHINIYNSVYNRRKRIMSFTHDKYTMACQQKPRRLLFSIYQKIKFFENQSSVLVLGTP